MAEYNPFAELDAKKPASAAAPAEEGGREWMDYPKAVASGAAGMAGNIARLFESENTPNVTAARRKLEGTSEAIATTMSPAGRRAGQREVLSLGENSIWQNPGDIPLMVTKDVVPSILLSAATGGVGGAIGKVAGAAGARVGATAGVAGAGYGMGAGGIESDIAEMINKARPEELGERYAQLRAKNVADRDARDQLTREAASGYKEAGGAASAVLNTMGTVGRAIIAKTSGRAAREAFTGGIARSALREAGNEALDEGLTGGAGELALQDRFGKDIDYGGLAERTARGGFSGFVTGGAGRAISGQRRPGVVDQRANIVGDDQQGALNRGAPAGAIATEPAAIYEQAKAQADQMAQQAMQVIPPGGEMYGPPAPPPAPAAQPGPVDRSMYPSGPMQGPPSPMQNFDSVDGSQTPPSGALQMWDDQGVGQMGPQRGTSNQPMNNMPPSNAQDVFVQGAMRVAQQNGGVVDPVQISAYFAQSGRPISPQGVLQQLAPLVQQGVLRQRGIPGMNGAPTFSIAPRPQQQGPMQPNQIPEGAPVMTPGRADPDAALGQAWETGVGAAPDAQLERAWEQNAGFNPTVSAPAALDKPAPKKAGPKAQAIKAKAAEKKAAAPKAQAIKAKAAAPSVAAEQAVTPPKKGRKKGKPEVVASPPKDKISRYKGGFGGGMRTGELQGPTPQAGAKPAAKAEAAKAKGRQAKPPAPFVAEKAAESAPSAPADLSPAEKLRAKQRARSEREAAIKTEMEAEGRVLARDNAPEPANKPEVKVEPDTKGLKRKSAQQLREMAVDLAPKDRAGNPDVAVIDGVIRAVYNEGIPTQFEAGSPLGDDREFVEAPNWVPQPIGNTGRIEFVQKGTIKVRNPSFNPVQGPTRRALPRPGLPELTFADWESELSSKDRQKVVSILQAWRKKYGKTLDARGKRALVTWITKNDQVEQRAATELASQAQLEKLRGFKGASSAAETKQGGETISDADLVKNLRKEFRKSSKGEEADIDALVGMIMLDAKREMEENGKLDYPQLMGKARRRLIALTTAQKGDETTDPDLSMDQWIRGPRAGNRKVPTQRPSAEDLLRRAEGGQMRPVADQNKLAERVITRVRQAVKDVATDAPGVRSYEEMLEGIGDPDTSQALPATAEGRARADELLEPVRRAEEAEKRAREAAARAKTEQNKVYEAGLVPVEQAETGVTRAGRRRDPDFFSTREPTGELKRLQRLQDVGRRIAKAYVDAGETPPPFAQAVLNYDALGIRGRPSKAKEAAAAVLRAQVMEEAERWDDGVMARLQDRLTDLKSRTPKGVFEEFAPPAESEPLPSALARIAQMARAFVERQKAGFRNPTGKLNMLDGLKGSTDPYARFIRQAIRYTGALDAETALAGKTDVALTDFDARRQFYFAGLDAKQRAEVQDRLDKLAKRRGQKFIPDSDVREVVRNYRNSKRIWIGRTTSGTKNESDFRETAAWSDFSEAVRKDIARGDFVVKPRKDETAEDAIVREVDKRYRDLYASAPNSELSAGQFNALIKDAVHRAQMLRAMVTNEYFLRHDGSDMFISDGLRVSESAERKATKSVFDSDAPGAFDDQLDPITSAEVERLKEGGFRRPSLGVPDGNMDFTVPEGEYSADQILDGAFGDVDTGPFQKLNDTLRERMRENSPRVEVLSKEAFEAMAERYENTLGTDRGFYLPSQNVLYIRNGMPMADLRETVMHELVHAATYDGLRNPLLQALGNDLVREAQPLLQGNLLDYRFSNIDEMVSYGFTNPEAAAEMGSIKLSDALARKLGIKGEPSLWDAFVEWVRRAIGLPESETTLLDGVLLLGKRAAEMGPQGPRGGEALRQIYNPGLTDQMAKNARDGLTNAKPGMRSRLLALATKTDIATIYGSMFDWAGDKGREYLRLDRATNPVDQVERAGALKASLARVLEKEHLPLIDRLENHRRLNPRSADKVADVLDDATTWNIDPTKATPPNTAGDKNAEQKRKMEQYTKLRERYLALDPEGRAIINEIKDTIQQTQAQLANATARSLVKQAWQRAHVSGKKGLPDQRTLERVAERALADQLTPDDVEWIPGAAIEYFRLAAKQLRDVGFYVPKYRHGEWVVFGERNDFQKLEYFDTEAQAMDRARAIEASGGYVKRVATRTFDPQGTHVQAKDRGQRKDLTTKFFVESENMVMEAFDTKAEAIEAEQRMREEGVANVKTEPREQAFKSLLEPLNPKQNEMITKAVQALTANEAEADKMLDTFRDATVRLMAGADMKHSSLRRKNTLGASRDHVRTMGRYVTSISQYMGGLQFKPYEDAALTAMNDWIANRRNTNESGSVNEARMAVLNELNTRIKEAKDNDGRGPIMQAIARFTAVHFLASPSYTIMQLFQPTLVGFPVLSRLFLNKGVGEIGGAMRDAHNDVGGLSMVGGTGLANMKRAAAKWRRTDTGGVVDMLSRVKNNLKDSGAADAQELANMLNELAMTGRIDEHAGIEVARVAQGEGNAGVRAFRMIEEFSRGMPAAAEVYNRSVVAVAAYRMAKSEGRSDNDAYLAAEKAVIDSQFIYNPENTPRAFTNAPGYVMPFLIFKKYVQAIYTQMGRSVYDSVKGENEQVRRAARRQFTMMMATHAMAAGAFGLPTEPFAIAAGLLALAMGEDEPWDWETEIIRGLNSVFGKDMTELITYGLPRAINLDLSSRLGLSSLLFMKELENFEPKTFFGYAGEFLGGAPGGIVSGWLRAGQLARNDADLSKIGAAFLPKAARDAVNAWKMSEEGITDSKGNPVDEGQTDWTDVMWKSIGFRSGFEANRSAAQRLAYKEQKEATTERRRLHTAWEGADTDAQKAAVQKRIDAFNKQYPAHEITEQSKTRSAAQKERRQESTVFGVPVKKGQEFDTPYNLRRRGAPAEESAPAPQPTSAPAGQRISFDTQREPFYRAIIVAEGTAQRGDPYNEVLGYGAFGRPPAPLVEMSLAEVYDWGQNVLRVNHRRAGSPGDPSNRGSSAAGAFQITGATMKRHMAEAGLSWNDKFTPDNQRKLALVIARYEGLGAWEGFKQHPGQRVAARRAFNLYPEEA